MTVSENNKVMYILLLIFKKKTKKETNGIS